MVKTYATLLAGTAGPGMYHWAGPESLDLLERATQAGWNTLALDTTRVRDRTAFYTEVSTSWGLPDWFGNNLDALFDALGEITAVPTILIWDGLGHLATGAPELAAAVLAVLSDWVEQAPDFSVIVRGDVTAGGSPLSDFDELL